jgi:hypothetical protein
MLEVKPRAWLSAKTLKLAGNLIQQVLFQFIEVKKAGDRLGVF